MSAEDHWKYEYFPTLEDGTLPAMDAQGVLTTAQPRRMASVQQDEETDIPRHSSGTSPNGEPVVSHEHRSINLIGDSRVHTGNVHVYGDVQHNNVTYYRSPTRYGDSSQFFSSLRSDNIADAQQRRFRRLKNEYQSGREIDLQSEISDNVPNRYSPYCKVKHPKIRARLAKVAGMLQFLDEGFAEYFQSVMPSFDRDSVCAKVKAARIAIAKSQSNNQGQAGHKLLDDRVVLGDLGHFCESVMDGWYDVQQLAQQQDLEFTITDVTTDELLRYLEDAFEAHYWRLMLDFFLEERRNRPNLSGKSVLQVLNSTKASIEEWKHKVQNDAKNADVEIGPIIDGINTRLDVLNSAWDEESHEHLLFDTVHEQAAIEAVNSSTAYEEPATKAKKTVWTMSLMILFIIGSFVPFSEGFSISRQSTETGSTSDADFWYLVSSSIVAVLGSLVMVTDLMDDSWNSPAYNMMWTFTGLGVVCAALSIGIYPICNTGWSSMLSYFGSIMSMGAVLVMTQAATRPPTAVMTEARKKQ